MIAGTTTWSPGPPGAPATSSPAEARSEAWLARSRSVQWAPLGREMVLVRGGRPSEHVSSAISMTVCAGSRGALLQRPVVLTFEHAQ